MGGMFSSQPAASSGTSSGASSGASNVAKKQYMYKSQNQLKLMTPDQISGLSFNDVDPNIDEKYANPPLDAAKTAALDDFLNRQRDRTTDFSDQEGGKRRRKTRKSRKIRRRKSRKVNKK
jgi:hypothetical protein